MVNDPIFTVGYLNDSPEFLMHSCALSQKPHSLVQSGWIYLMPGERLFLWAGLRKKKKETQSLYFSCAIS